VAQIPDEVRPVVRQELDALVDGRRPEHLLWVSRYGENGATLVRQPDDLLDHPYADAVRTTVAAGTSWCPCGRPRKHQATFRPRSWRPDGSATLHDVHVL